MSISWSLLGLGIAVAPIVALGIWLFASPSRQSEKRRDELKTRHLQRQPWDADGAGGRANR